MAKTVRKKNVAKPVKSMNFTGFLMWDNCNYRKRSISQCALHRELIDS